MFSKGDFVQVYSLQSFFYGGFLYGRLGFVSQDQINSKSVIVSVIRNYNGVYKVDSSYEVYIEQVRLVKSVDELKKKHVKKFFKLYDKMCYGDDSGLYEYKYMKLLLKVISYYKLEDVFEDKIFKYIVHKYVDIIPKLALDKNGEIVYNGFTLS